MTHIYVSKITIIGSDNGLSPGRRQAIIWTNAGILLIGPLGTNFSEILIEIDRLSFKKMHLKMSSAKLRPFCLGLNVLRCVSDGYTRLHHLPAPEAKGTFVMWGGSKRWKLSNNLQLLTTDLAVWGTLSFKSVHATTGSGRYTCPVLTHWGRDKMDAISQTTFSSAFSWMKMHEFRLRFHWSLFLRFKLTIFQHWFR